MVDQQGGRAVPHTLSPCVSLCASAGRDSGWNPVFHLLQGGQTRRDAPGLGGEHRPAGPDGCGGLR